MRQLHHLYSNQAGIKHTTDQLYLLSKPGTTLHRVLSLSNQVGSQYILLAVEDYRQLFFYDNESKKVIIDKLRDSDEKEFKKFVLSLTQPYFEELGKALKL